MGYARTVIAALGALAVTASALTVVAQPAAPAPHWADQGPQWTDGARQSFYSLYQGAQIIPLSWMRALKRSDGSAFLSGGLARYGYLSNPASSFGLPVGFTVSPIGVKQVGMTCAACHTRQIEVGAEAWRIDGGPAIVDFGRLLKDLDDSVGAALASDVAFDGFAFQVLGAAPTPAAEAQLRLDVTDWYERNHALITLSLQGVAPWGMARADAVQMIFNRLTGLDIGPTPNRIMVGNIKPADAPVRYPFLWNAAYESKTQWLGFAGNGSDVLGMLRNLGQVIGVFAKFNPEPRPIIGPDYWAKGQNSISIAGLGALETLMKTIGPPKWPWAYSKALADQGKTLFVGKGKCASCHGDPSEPSTMVRTTPILPVGTDTRQATLLTRTADTGVLVGDSFLFKKLASNDTALNVVTHAVGNTYLQSFFADTNPEAFQALQIGAFTKPENDALQLQLQTPKAPGGFEARRLKGVWAAAPYLHNGSVPTLTDLLNPAPIRPASFPVGPEYDPGLVGLSATQPRISSMMQTTLDCAHPDSGNSRCGHEYGTTTLSGPEKKALIEYLKTL